MITKPWLVILSLLIVSLLVALPMTGTRAGILLGALAVFGLGLLYAHFKGNPAVVAGLSGVGAAAVGLVLAVTLQIGRRELAFGPDLAILASAFILVGVDTSRPCQCS